MMRTLALLAVLAGVVFGLAGCSSGGDENVDPKAQPAGEQPGGAEAKPAQPE